MDINKYTFINRFVKELEENNVALFVGAGLSTASGYVNWKELLRPLAKELDINIDQEHDLVAIAQYIKNENGRNNISQHIMDKISPLKQITENHKILAKLPINTYWTTNYDKLIEKAIEEEGKVIDTKYTIHHLSITKNKRDVILYKMHGDIDHPSEAVLTKDDYEKYHLKMAPYITALSGDLVSKTFLFLGFSFTDPNLDSIMSRVRAYFEGHERQHYCIFKRCERADYNSEVELIAATVKQKLLIKDLDRVNIKIILIDHYNEVTEILKKIERLYKRKTIFLSGSAHEFNQWPKYEVENFLCKLGSTLIDKNYKISSGIGLGIGNAFVTGAIQAVYNNDGKVNEYISMSPFPQYIEDETLRNETWDKYRKEIIGSAGIALFFMGNKLVNEKVELADGMKKEFDIAHQLGLSVIPIGCSGYVAKELWEEVINNISKYYNNSDEKIIDAIRSLGERIEKPEQLISKITDIVDLISKE